MVYLKSFVAGVFFLRYLSLYLKDERVKGVKKWYADLSYVILDRIQRFVR